VLKCVLSAFGMLLIAGSASAATFNLVYDNAPDQVLGTSALVGSGTFTYDGPAVAGAFALSSLAGMTFDALIMGRTVATADLATDLSTSGIFVYSIGGGEFGMVFTGSGGSYNGSFDLVTPGITDILTHEPTSAIGDPLGCCGGTGSVNRYVLGGPASQQGDYAATTAPIPEPCTLALCMFGLIGLTASRHSGLHRRSEVVRPTRP